MEFSLTKLKDRLTDPDTLKLAAFVAAGCAVAYYFMRQSSESPKEEDKPHEINLMAAQASQRASLVRDVTYRLYLELEADAYKGAVLLKFKCLDPTQSLWLDYSNTSVSSVTVNEVPQSVQWSQGRLELSELAEDNEVMVEFAGTYHHTSGFVKLTDSEDQYVYTSVKPFGANHVFPCFDQPDIKAKVQLSVEVPVQWKVVANEPAVDTADTKPNRKLWEFKQTQPISTYLIGLWAGPFAEVRLDSNKSNVPLGLYSRKLLELSLEEGKVKCLSLTIQGLLALQDYLDMPYQFSKFDQVFLPNVQSEPSVGCLLVDEQLLLQDPTHQQLSQLSTVTLPGMASQWFGCLVTIRWWDDLWLTEALARHVASVVQPTINMLQSDEESAEDSGAAETSLAEQRKIADTHTAKDYYAHVIKAKHFPALQKLVEELSFEEFRAATQHFLVKFESSTADSSDFLELTP